MQPLFVGNAGSEVGGDVLIAPLSGPGQPVRPLRRNAAPLAAWTNLTNQRERQ
jgi:hypothetical protein